MWSIVDVWRLIGAVARAKHGFEYDTANAAYSNEAAHLAWSRTIDFLKQTTA